MIKLLFQQSLYIKFCQSKLKQIIGWELMRVENKVSDFLYQNPTSRNATSLYYWFGLLIQTH